MKKYTFSTFLVSFLLIFGKSLAADADVLDPTTTESIATTVISTKPFTSSTASPTEKNTTTKVTTLPPDTTTPTTPPTTSPATTSTSPITTSSTEKPTTSSTEIPSTSTVPPSPSTTAAPAPRPRPSHWSTTSFVGGMVFALGMVAIAFVSWKFYKSRNERNYHTL